MPTKGRHWSPTALKTLRQRVEPVWDIVRRLYQQTAEDNVLFLAGGLAFNILLALVPFLLLIISGLSFLLGRSQDDAARTVTELFSVLLPRDSTTGSELLCTLISDVLRTRGAVTTYSAILFAWFSTRLFGSFRSVLALVFDGTDRGIVAGKAFDFLATIVATLAVSLYVVVSFYLDLASTEGVQLLMRFGMRESAMGLVTYFTGRLFTLTLVFALFYALYRYLPRRRPFRRTAAVGALTAALFFEVMRSAWTLFISQSNPGSLYTGTIAAIVTVVFWTYYAALVFLIGAEVAQAYELRKGELALRMHLEAPNKEVPVPTAPQRTTAEHPGH